MSEDEPGNDNRTDLPEGTGGTEGEKPAPKPAPEPAPRPGAQPGAKAGAPGPKPGPKPGPVPGVKAPQKEPPQPGTPKQGPAKPAAPPPKAAPDGDAEEAPAKQKDSRERRAREIERRKAAAAAAAAAKRKRQISTAVVIIVVVVFGAALFVFLGGGKSNTPSTVKSPAVTPIPTSTVYASPVPGPDGPEAEPVPNGPALASTASAASGQVVDGINCQSSEQFVEHLHAHLAVYVQGSAKMVPEGIGIPGGKADANGFVSATGNCIYWLHTHAADGIIHIESPTTRTYTLGDFFDVWNQPLGPNQVGPATGPVTAFYNGQIYTGSNPRDIPLTAQAQIQLVVGNPIVGPESITFKNGL